jgi:hypothetical protein
MELLDIPQAAYHGFTFGILKYKDLNVGDTKTRKAFATGL